MKTLSQAEFLRSVRQVAQQMVQRGLGSARIYGVPRGGVPVAYAIGYFLGRTIVVDNPAKADIIVDDIIDSGATAAKYPGQQFAAVFGRSKDYGNVIVGERSDEWLVFPWEGSAQHSTEDILNRVCQRLEVDDAADVTERMLVTLWQEMLHGRKT